MRQVYEFGDFRVDPIEQLLLHQGQPVPLAPKVFETLLILLNSEGRLIDKNDFIDRLWPEVFVEDVALAQNISQLRKALGDGKDGIPDDPNHTQAWVSVYRASEKSHFEEKHDEVKPLQGLNRSAGMLAQAPATTQSK